MGICLGGGERRARETLELGMARDHPHSGVLGLVKEAVAGLAEEETDLEGTMAEGCEEDLMSMEDGQGTLAAVGTFHEWGVIGGAEAGVVSGTAMRMRMEHAFSTRSSRRCSC